MNNQQRYQNNDDCCGDCQECGDCAGSCCCDDCCKDCECQECGCDCIETIQTNCFDNWQCCLCMQCCTAGDILTELNFNRHIELEEEQEAYIKRFKETIIDYKLFKKFNHSLLGESHLLRCKTKDNKNQKLILKTYWFMKSEEYSKSLTIWHQSVFLYPELCVYGSRVQDICLDRWRIAILLPKLHSLKKKHEFQFFTFLIQIISQILNQNEDKSLFDEKLVFFDSEYILMPSQMLPQTIYQLYKFDTSRKHPPEWETDDILDWNKGDTFLIGLCALSQILNNNLDQLYKEGKLNPAQLDIFINGIKNTEQKNLLIRMLWIDPNERYSLQQVQNACRNKPKILLMQDRQSNPQSPPKSTQRQSKLTISRVENYSLQKGGFYTGDQIDNKKHGYGKLMNPDGSGYEGEWYQDQMHGKGEQFLADGRILYKGSFYYGKYQNFGHLININSLPIQNINFRDLRSFEKFWTKYEGDFKENKRNGYGIIYFSSQEKWAGEFGDDIPNGFGTFYGLSGEVSGKWVKGILFD